MMLAPLLAMILAAPVLVTDIDAARVDGELRVRLIASGPLAEAKAEMLSSELVLHVPGATLAKDRDVFHHHHRYIQVRRETGGVRVEVPLGKRVSCAAAVQAAPQPDGLMVRTQCKASKEDKEAAAEAKETKAAATTPSANAAVVAKEAVAITTVALPPAAAPIKLAAAAPIKLAAAAPAKVAAAAPAEVPALVPLEKVTAVETAVKPGPNAPIELKPSAPAGSDANFKLALPAMALAAAGAAAFWLKRKRAPISRVLQIIETTALGPKRSLIVARVGAETLLLSSSEAGITLLTALPPGTTSAIAANFGALPAQALPAAVAHPERHADPQDAGAEPSRSAAPKAAGPITAALRSLLKSRPSAPPPSFEALFAESAEDQELRGKLRSGHLAHVR